MARPERRTRAAGLLLLGAICLVSTAQRPGRRGGGGPQPGGTPGEFSAFNARYDGRFTFVRIRYTPAATGYGGGGGFFGGINYQWDHDYPRSDHQFPTLLGELTTIAARNDSSNILAVTDPELLRYPVAYFCEAGWWTQTDEEAAAMRAYLLKGGFIIFDDFAGSGALGNFQRQMARVLPEARLVPLTLDNPIFHAFFDIPTLEMRHPYYGVNATFLGIYEDNDPARRLLAIVNYNNDISESWEWSGTGFIPIDLSNEAFKLGVNYVVYAMTH